jgi:dinuclear metal center YbgI/SA1388 family protein
MKIKDIYNFLDNLSPFELQEKWDNSGLIVGNMDNIIKKVYISLDLDSNNIKDIEPDSLIITHHPLIFTPLKRINYDNYSTKILQTLIQRNISLISLHTNFDKTHLNRYFVKKVLGLKIKKIDNFIIYCEVNQNFIDFCNYIQSKIDREYLPVVGDTNAYIKDIAVVTGSGMSLLDNIESDCFITGDIKYHEAMSAKVKGINLIDIGHFESEIYFAEIIYKNIKKYLKKNQIQGIISNSKNPFKIIS